MKRKTGRILLLSLITLISIFLGSAVILNAFSSPPYSINYSIGEETNLEVPANYILHEILGVEACECLGNVYADDTPPVIEITSPPNNSLILINTTIYVEISDDFPAMEGGPSFVPEFVYYSWNDATSNETAYSALEDEPPAEDEPVRVELTLPNTDEGATHVLTVYAVDYEGNWTILKYVYTTPGTGEESSVTWTTTIRTTTTEKRRTDGFLLIPMLFILFGLVNILTWRRRKQEI
ncbi:MAG: hypothetical protein ACXABI_01910 [Candidatus Hodarchaeales archaeon]